MTDRPFIPPVQQPTGVTRQKQSSGAAGQSEVKKATQPVEAPIALTATQPVEAPGASSEMLFTGQDSSLPSVVDSPPAQPSTATKKSAISLSGSRVPAQEPAADTPQFSDHTSSYADEGEVSDLESTSPDQKRSVRCGPGTQS